MLFYRCEFFLCNTEKLILFTIISLYEGSKTHPTYKLIGRYQPETKHRVMGPIGEKLTGVLISGNIYEMPTIGSMNKKFDFFSIA